MAEPYELRFFEDVLDWIKRLAKEDPDTTLTAEEREVGGLGIFLVKKTMDNVHYVRSNHANVLTFEKLIDRADDPIEV